MKWNRKPTEEELAMTAQPPIRVIVTPDRHGGEPHVRAIQNKPEGMSESIYPEKTQSGFGWKVVRNLIAILGVLYLVSLVL